MHTSISPYAYSQHPTNMCPHHLIITSPQHLPILITPSQNTTSPTTTNHDNLTTHHHLILSQIVTQSLSGHVASPSYGNSMSLTSPITITIPRPHIILNSCNNLATPHDNTTTPHQHTHHSVSPPCTSSFFHEDLKPTNGHTLVVTLAPEGRPGKPPKLQDHHMVCCPLLLLLLLLLMQATAPLPSK